jgi:hypothetical protein
MSWTAMVTNSVSFNLKAPIEISKARRTPLGGLTPKLLKIKLNMV